MILISSKREYAISYLQSIATLALSRTV